MDFPGAHAPRRVRREPAEREAGVLTVSMGTRNKPFVFLAPSWFEKLFHDLPIHPAHRSQRQIPFQSPGLPVFGWVLGE